jgi:hypothetical protein
MSEIPFPCEFDLPEGSTAKYVCIGTVARLSSSFMTVLSSLFLDCGLPVVEGCCELKSLVDN